MPLTFSFVAKEMDMNLPTFLPELQLMHAACLAWRLALALV